MVFIATSDTMPQVVQQESIVLAAASNSASSVRKMTYGVCELFYATEDEIDATDDSSVNSLSATSYMIDFLQPDLREKLSTPYGANGETLEWFGNWHNSLKVTLLRAPEHGKFVNINNDPNNEYLPALGYVGKDHIDLLVEGKDDLGHPIALTLKYFINVLPRQELHQIVKDRKSSKIEKKLCGTSESYWHISESQTVNGLEQTYTMLQSASYGWYIDYTPYLNNDSLSQHIYRFRVENYLTKN